MAEISYGEAAVGLSFNPSADSEVDSIKKAFAELIDKMDDIRLSAGRGERARLASVAITEMQTAQMWAVKTVTWRD